MSDLIQTVDKPTDRCGYILDWILHRRDDEILQTTLVSYELTSDHFTMVCDLNFVSTMATTIVHLQKEFTLS